MLARSLWGLALSASVVLAGLTNTLNIQTQTAVQCTTKKTSVSVKNVPTSTKTSQPAPQIVLATVISHPIKTVTPAAITKSSTKYVTSTVTTTASEETDTFSTTTTSVVTTTVTSTEAYTTTTATTVSTTSTSTSTIAATASIVPVDQTVVAANSKRDLIKLPGRSMPMPRAQAASKKNCPLSNDKFAASVSCIKSITVKYVKQIIVIGSPITVTLPPRVITVVVTSTMTSTSTVPAVAASTTLTFSEISTSTVASTVTTTATTTSTATEVATATATFYAACGDDNIIGPNGPNGGYLGDVYRSDSGSYMSASASSNYECCVKCLTSSTCQYSVFYGGSHCILAQGTTCSAAYQAGTVYETNAQNQYNPLYLSNGYCGQVVDGGIDDSLGS
ncbi:hypothetical protein E8E14_007692 [Neopestalotiopsis sp. 37M]|nr:hypothetical protein E8E14_007692 [Neopestalotiopsis sp. 37M]